MMTRINLALSLGIYLAIGSGLANAQSDTPLDDGIDSLVLVEPVDPEGWTLDYIINSLNAVDEPTRDALFEDYDDDGDLDLYVINSPGGDNALLGGVAGLAGSGDWGAVVQDDGDFLIYLRDASIPAAPTDLAPTAGLLDVVGPPVPSRIDDDGVLNLFSVDPPNAAMSGIHTLIQVTQIKASIATGTYESVLTADGASLDLFLASPDFGDGTIQIRMTRSGVIPEPSAVCLLLAGVAACCRSPRKRA